LHALPAPPRIDASRRRGTAPAGREADPIGFDQV